MVKKSRSQILFALVFGALFSFSTISLAQQKTSTKSIMHNIFGEYRNLVPLTFNLKEFSDLKNREKINKSLDYLIKNTQDLEKHKNSHDETFLFLNQNFNIQLKTAKHHFKNNQFRSAQFELRHLTQNCIACHTRLPEKFKAPNSLVFFNDIKESELTIAEKLEFLIASRQFDKAIKMYNDLFKSEKITKEISPILISNHLVNYLVLTLRVKRSPSTALKGLKAIQKSPNLPIYTQSNLKNWITFLETFKDKPWQETSLDEVEEMISKGQKMNHYALDENGLVAFIIASSVLNQYIYNKESTLKNPQKARAYYLLGTIEMAIDNHTLFSPLSYHLEMAIRTDPKSKVALLSFKALESYIYFENSGSSGTYIPSDQFKKLKELEKLVNFDLQNQVN